MTRLALFAALLSTMALIPASALSLRGREIYPIPDDVQTQMRKYTWKADCPVPISSLTYLQLNYLDEGGVVHQGELVVHRSLATEVLDIFEDIANAAYPIHSMKLACRFQGSDNATMEANNTSAFNCRAITGKPGSYSLHAYGCAIDVNPFTNPYVRGDEILPPDAAQYANRSLHIPSTIYPGTPAYAAFDSRNWDWGGSWFTRQDYQHFQKDHLYFQIMQV